MFKLVIQDDEGKTTVVPLIRDEITIGRKEGNTIRLTERNVSRRHARILRNNGEVQIEDLGSYNGIRVNNARIAERVSLRVSDQVQIGDYKLYLKAEGVEQVDDARTMPIERVDSALPTEVMPAQTPPMAAQAPMAPPNRSAAAIADTDPGGRPVATPAQVAALSQPVGYGKLVVISSNFAGKEFDLTRPQMIIGRTDDNDIVVNHRSISRNHAKVTRDPETGRYTISDLQSSNGVRVNGQDYGKVELRRGDTVDLGHVRLRFVEPGEDFVFSRDAVIADVPETGSRKGLLVAAIFAVLVLGGVGAYFAFKGKDGGELAGSGSGGQGSATMVGSNDVVAAQTGSNDEVGSGATNVVPPETPDAATQQTGSATVAPNDLAGSLKVECKQFAVERNWVDASKCAEKLAEHDPKTAKALRALYKQELENDLARGRIIEAINKGDLVKAREELAGIEEESVYRAETVKMVEDLQTKVTARYRDEALAIKRSGKCDGYDRVLAEARQKGGQPAYQAVLREKCEKAPVVAEPKDCSSRLLDGTKACKQQFCANNPGDTRCGGGAVTVTPPANCDADALKEEGMGYINSGQHAAALARFEASLKCKRDPYVIQLAFMESCSSGNSAKAKQYYKQLTPAQQQKFAQICIRQKVEYQ